MQELVQNFQALKEQVALAEMDLTKFVNGLKGGKAASVRVRKNMLNIKSHAQAIRTIISQIKNEGTYKTEK